VFVRARTNHVAVGGDDVRGPQVIECEAVFRHQPADPAAECQAGDPRAPDDAAGRRESVQLCLAIEFSPQDAALRAHRARGASTWMPFIGDRSIISPWSIVARPATL
jgi:hypothetical protein